MNELIRNVLEWGYARGLHDKDLRPQLIKLTEELGEIAAGVARQDPARVIDGVGDLLVVLVNFGACFARQAYPDDTDEQQRCEEYFLEMCLNHAWHTIKHRTGETRDGVFVKAGESA